MKLRIKFLEWSTGIPVAIIHPATAEELGVHAKDRVSIRKINDGEFFSTIIDIASGIFKKNEIVVSSELKEKLNLREGQLVNVNYSPSSKSMEYIKEKLKGKELSKEKIFQIIKDVGNNSLSEAEVSVFISAMYVHGMKMKETVYLVGAILASGKKLHFNNKYVVDKHCIGGIPGNRTTPLVVSICAAAGLIFPKSSSRAITSAAGTSDTIETLAQVDFKIEDVEKIVKKTGACLVWGGELGIVPADSKILKIEKLIMIDPEAQLLASIMSKKLAAGSNYILIDIPYGNSAKVSKEHGLRLKKKFELLGKSFKKNVFVVLTHGDEPIGNGIGPVLEMIDVLKVLTLDKTAPKDLMEKSLFLAGQIFEMTGKSKKGQGIALAKKMLESKEAFKKFEEIIHAQNGRIKKLIPGKFKKDIFANENCKITFIDNKKVNSLCRIAGCPVDKGSGAYLYYHIGEEIKKGDTVLTIYSENKDKLKSAYNFYLKSRPIKF
jgi:putative thymidine phosphorylase